MYYADHPPKHFHAEYGGVLKERINDNFQLIELNSIRLATA
jgi:hypothetical protein